MADTTWPSADSFPQLPLTGSYSETPPVTAVRTEMDAGAAKVRNRYTDGPRPFTATYMLIKNASWDHPADLDTFYVTSTEGGTKTIELVHPRTEAAVVVRFLGPPTYTNVSGDIWHAACSFEELP